MLDQRILDKLEIGDCWEWSAGQDGHGYGAVWDPIRKRMNKAHRYVWEQLVGPIPSDRQIDHLCRNRLCVNPDHLELVTHRENALRGQQGAWLRRKTHCPQGHEYTADNTETLLELI